MTMANIGLTLPSNPDGHRGSTVSAMRWIKRGAAVLVLVLLAGAAYTGWYVYGAWPEPVGYDFPRHSIWGGGPLALFEGTLGMESGCVRTAGPSALTVVWPPGYRLVIVDDEPIVIGGSRDVRMGHEIRMGGGSYGRPPPTSFNIGDCPGPYFLSTGFED
jgi:hypothetical protein